MHALAKFIHCLRPVGGNLVQFNYKKKVGDQLFQSFLQLSHHQLDCKRTGYHLLTSIIAVTYSEAPRQELIGLPSMAEKMNFSSVFLLLTFMLCFSGELIVHCQACDDISSLIPCNILVREPSGFRPAGIPDAPQKLVILNNYW